MPRDLGELGLMYSREEVRELRQGDQAQIEKLEADKKLLEEKISRLSKLAPPSPDSLQSHQMPAGNGTFLFIDQLGSRLLWKYKGFSSFRNFEGKFSVSASTCAASCYSCKYT